MQYNDEEIPVLIDHGAPTDASLADRRRVPLTIICGFLGSGKSTLLQRILTERHGYRIAVIMNEFGDTADIEAKTISVSNPQDPRATSEEFLELANGCLCCSIKDTGVAAIEKLMHRKGAFDHILLETTGLADPGPIASMFWHNEEFATGLGRDITLDGVICVVDAFFAKKQMTEDSAVDDIGESLRQIAGADVILLNKVDLTTSDQVQETEHMLRGVNPAASVYRTVRGNIDLKYIMDIGAYAAAPRSLRSCYQNEPCEGHTHTEGTHYEIRGISSLKLSVPVLNHRLLDSLDEWIRSLLWEGAILEHNVGLAPYPDLPSTLEVLRCKGLFVLEDGSQYVLQGVRSLYEITPLDDVASKTMGVPDEGKLVLIGTGLNDIVRRSFETIFTS